MNIITMMAVAVDMSMNIITMTISDVYLSIINTTTLSITKLQRIFRQTTRRRFIQLRIWVVPTVPQRWRAGLTS